MNKFTKSILAVSCAAMMGGAIAPVQAADWLMLQGTEPSDAAPRAKVWGFVQTQYQQDYSDGAGAGLYIPPKLIGPNLDSQAQFNVNRARIGVRGQGMPLDGKVNYFLMAEFGNNALTNGSAAISDASITLNHLDHARIRMGLFKTPVGEEALQGIGVIDYVNFTETTNQLMLERFPTAADTNFIPPHTTPNAGMNAFSRTVGAFRDVGVQVFDTFKGGGWEHSYAVMYGNGNGTNFGDNDANKDTYLYWASEKVFGGKGPRRQGMKFFAWSQNGKRTDAYDTTQVHERTRTGFGMKYLKGAYRVTVESIQGKGMIFQGPHRPEDIVNDKTASGYYLDLGWYVPKSKWEIDLRYDNYTRGENHATSVAGDESNFVTNTLGAQYHFNKKTHLTMDYAIRTYTSDTAAVNGQFLGMGPRLALQMTHIF
jgi:phosphate-selective porin